MPDAPSPQRRFRFGVRTALIGMTIAAVASWVYWDGLERYRIYRDQQDFERAVQQTCEALKVIDSETVNIRGRARAKRSQRDATGRMAGFHVYKWPNYYYVLYFPPHDSPHFRRTSMEMFRLPPVPPEYTAKTSSPLHAISSWQHDKDARRQWTYSADFFEVISGDRRDTLGFEYELVYAAHITPLPNGSPP